MTGVLTPPAPAESQSIGLQFPVAPSEPKIAAPASVPPKGYFARRWRDFSGSGSRVIGLDMARGLAVLGMFAVHTHVSSDPWNWLDPRTWVSLTWGNSSATFAVLAGLAIAMISGRTRLLDGVPLVQARTRILVRAAMILVIGGILTSLHTELVVIVEFYAIYFAMSLPFLRMRWWVLAIIAAAWMLVMPVVRLFIAAFAFDSFNESAILNFMIVGFYPALTWFGYTLTGMAIGRMPLDRWWARLSIFGTGVVLTSAAQALAFAFEPISGPLTQSLATAFPNVEFFALFSAEGHSGSSLDFFSSTGVACMVIGVCLIGQKYLRWPMLPISAIGSMSLTAYSMHAIAFLTIPNFGDRPLAWLELSLSVAIFCVVWRLLLPKGPLEWLLTWVSTRASDVRERRRPIGSIHDDSRGLAVGRAIR